MIFIRLQTLITDVWMKEDSISILPVDKKKKSFHLSLKEIDMNSIICLYKVT